MTTKAPGSTLEAGRRERTIRRQIVAARGRDRARTLRAVVIEAVDFGPRDIESGDDREWLEQAIADWLEAGIDSEVDVLARLIAEALDAAPRRLGERYDHSHEAEDYGLD